MLNTSSVWANTTGRLRFALAYSNDVDRTRFGMFAGPAGRAAWLARVATWVRAMAHERYLVVDARPVFQVLIPDILLSQCAGNVTLAEELLERVRAAGRAAGVGAPVIGGGWLVPALPPGAGGAPLPHPQGYMLYPNADVPCNAGPCDIARVAGAAPADCMATCNSTAGCTSFAFYAANGTCVLKSYAGPGAPGAGDFYVRVLDDIAWEWRGTYNDAEVRRERARAARRARTLPHRPDAARAANLLLRPGPHEPGPLPRIRELLVAERDGERRKGLPIRCARFARAPAPALAPGATASAGLRPNGAPSLLCRAPTISPPLPAPTHCAARFAAEVLRYQAEVRSALPRPAFLCVGLPRWPAAPHLRPHLSRRRAATRAATRCRTCRT
jgi:hypothetical protein